MQIAKSTDMRELTFEQRRKRAADALAASTRPNRTQPPVQKVGYVERAPFGVGSKSERDAIMLRAPDSSWELRRETRSIWDRDDVLERLVGRKVRLSGFESGTTFVVRDFEEL